MAGQFYIIATPIGNLTDITLRAVDVLKTCTYIACEDTRVTKILLDKYCVKAKLFDCHKFNEKERSEKIINLLEAGETIALVSDAGTPLISDPGSVLLDTLRNKGINYTSLPGACAITTFLSQIPRKNEEFAFIGFIPRTKKQQTEILNKYKNTNCIFYESPNRLLETLKNISDNIGAETYIAIGRELTKVYEEIKISTVSQLINYYENHPLKGEIIAMVYERNSDLKEEELKEKIQILKEDNFSPKDISKIISKLYGENKNKIYKLALD